MRLSLILLLWYWLTQYCIHCDINMSGQRGTIANYNSYLLSIIKGRPVNSI